MSRSIRVLVVDDSPTMRGLIAAVLKRDPEIEIVATAGDAYSARDAINEHKPDVITLDFEMPGVDGISFLKKIMKHRPTPVVMISSLTDKGADLAITALESGAFDCIAKPRGGIRDEAFADLPEIVKAASHSQKGEASAAPSRIQGGVNFDPANKIIAIGASTGGVEALTKVISSFPANCPPTVIVQHMPELFTSSFAGRLNSLSAPTVTEARDGDPLKQGHVYLAPGGARHLVIEGSREYRCQLVDMPKVSGHRPSVDVMFDSVAECAGKKTVAAILTGMGADGANGMLAIRKAGGRTFGQDEASCVVYGMPRAADKLGAVEKIIPLDRMARVIMQACSRSSQERAAS